MRTLQIIGFSALVLGFTACQKEVITPNAPVGDNMSVDYTTNAIQEEQSSDFATPDWSMRSNTEGGSSAGNGSTDGGVIINGTITDPNSDEDSEKKKGSN